MSSYETICVIRPELQDGKLKEIDGKIQKVLSPFGVKEVKKQDWGLRRLAYPINNLTTAHYFRYEFSAEGDAVQILEKNLGYEEDILRFLTIKLTKNSQNIPPQKISHFGPEVFDRGREFKRPFKGKRGDYNKNK